MSTSVTPRQGTRQRGDSPPPMRDQYPGFPGLGGEKSKAHLTRVVQVGETARAEGLSLHPSSLLPRAVPLEGGHGQSSCSVEGDRIGA